MTDTGDTLEPGTRLGELEIERVLGAGGFGVTYLARDLSLNVRRAVKEYLPRDWGTRLGDGTIGPRTGSDAEDYRWGLERFLKEARILAQFDHPNLVRVYRVFEARGTAYMVMEYVEGRTLKKEVEASGPLPEARVREVLAALTEGLEAVHGAELLHRDIKPENVMVRPDGTLVLIDFGAARQAIGGHSRSLTAVLTPGYAPIEQYSGRGHQGPWTDIYALGAVAYWALSGEAPEEATERVRGDRLLPVAQAARVRVSARLAAAVDAALTVNEAERPQSLQEWRGMLERGAMKPPPVGEEEPPAAPPRGAARVVLPETAEERSGQGTAGRRRRLGVVAAAGLAVAALVVALTVPWNGSDTDVSTVQEEGPVVIDPDPNTEPSPAAVEAALGLDQAARQEIQWGLKAAGFDVGVADGRFGPQTRDVIRNWQAAQAEEHPTGYLDRPAVQNLRAAGAPLAEAERKRLELAAAEAERKRLELAAAEAERKRLELAAAEAERERLEDERLERERRERLEGERLERERRERLEGERLERERRERLEGERLERERLEAERLERERRREERQERACERRGGEWIYGECEIPVGNFCQAPIVRCPMYETLPVGAPCYCPTPYGPVSGRVTR